jgi:hypothetical protein
VLVWLAAGAGTGSSINPTQIKMIITRLVPFLLITTVLGLALPASANTMSVPSAANAAYTFDVPADWKPKGDPNDEVVEATAPGDHAYLMAWMAGGDLETFAKDLDATLKDAMKSIDPDTKKHELDQNGSHFFVFNGSGVDKRAGTKVKFIVGVFDAGGGKVGVVYADYDADAPDSTMNVLEGILKTIKVTKK